MVRNFIGAAERVFRLTGDGLVPDRMSSTIASDPLRHGIANALRQRCSGRERR